MRQGCLSWLVGIGLVGGMTGSAQAEGPLARLRQRLAPPAASASRQADEAGIQALVNVRPVVPHVAPAMPPVAAPRYAAAAPSAPSRTPVATVPAQGRTTVSLSTPPGRVPTPGVTSSGETSPPRSLPATDRDPVDAAPHQPLAQVADAAPGEPPPFPAAAARSRTSVIELTSATGLFEPTGTTVEPNPMSAADAPAAPRPDAAPADRDPFAAAPGAVAPQPLTAPHPHISSAPLLDLTGFTLEQAVQTAITNNPSIKQAAATANKAAGTRRQIGKYPNPTIGYNADDIGEEGTAGNQGVFLQQTIMLGGKLKLNEHVADWEVQMLSWQTEAQKYRVCNDVRKQFYVTLGAQRKVQLAEQLKTVADRNAQLAGEAINVVRELEALGEAKLTLLQAQVQADEITIILNNSHAERDAAWRQLAALMGTPHSAYCPLADALDQGGAARELELARQQLLTMSPLLAQARSEVQRAGWRIQREKVQQVPNVQLQLIGAHMNTTGNDTVSVQVGLPVPLFNNNDGNIHRAMADYQRACWNVQRLELALQNQLAERFQQYQTSANKLAVYRNDILPKFDKANQELADQNLYSGLPQTIANRIYFNAKLDELQALVDLRTAEVALDGLLLSGAFDELVDNEMDDTNRWNALSGQ